MQRTTRKLTYRNPTPPDIAKKLNDARTVAWVLGGLEARRTITVWRDGHSTSFRKVHKAPTVKVTHPEGCYSLVTRRHAVNLIMGYKAGA